jgi:hypothetical protein
LDDVSQGHNSDIIDGYNKYDIDESPDYWLTMNSFRAILYGEISDKGIEGIYYA